jgi:hypothetical protein
MNQHEWLRSKDPQAMLSHIQANASPGQFRLFAVACSSRVLNLTEELKSECQSVINLARKYAESGNDCSTPQQLAVVVAAAAAAYSAAAAAASRSDAKAYAVHACYASSMLTGTGYADDEASVWSVASDAAAADDTSKDNREREIQADLLRSILGNSFCCPSSD